MTNARALKEFETAIARFPETMTASLTYIARLVEPEPYLLKARLNFHSLGMKPASKLFQSAEIVAGKFDLSDLDLKPDELFESIFEGRIHTPQGTFAFLPQIEGGYTTSYIPFHPEGLAEQSRVGVLQIRGTDQSDHWQNPHIDWDLRSSNLPYDNLNELSIDFGMGAIIERSTIFEAVAHSIVVVDLSRQISGEIAEVGVFAAKGLDRSKISIGYRIIDKGITTERSSIFGDKLAWVDEDARDVGHTEIPCPPASLVNCYARYEGVTYHSGFILDPSLVQNPRRAAYERFDPNLAEVRELLTTKDKRRARDFESAIACLLWMIGFSPCYIGGIKVLQDGPDIIATTPSGNVIVAECTIGTLKADSKMPKLLSRTVAVRERLASAGQLHLRVLPLMVTSLSRDEIAAEMRDAVTNGVLVISQDDFEEAITRTLILPHADQLFVEFEQSLRTHLEALS